MAVVRGLAPVAGLDGVSGAPQAAALPVLGHGSTCVGSKIAAARKEAPGQIEK